MYCLYQNTGLVKQQSKANNPLFEFLLSYSAINDCDSRVTWWSFEPQFLTCTTSTRWWPRVPLLRTSWKSVFQWSQTSGLRACVPVFRRILFKLNNNSALWHQLTLKDVFKNRPVKLFAMFTETLRMLFTKSQGPFHVSLREAFLSGFSSRNCYVYLEWVFWFYVMNSELCKGSCFLLCWKLENTEPNWWPLSHQCVEF